MTLVILGPHAVGKTSLGKALAVELGWTFHPEIGELLARKHRKQGDASTPQEDFDRALIQAELDRDASWGSDLRIVETWHPGNLAYAERRSPVVAHEFAPLLRLGPSLVLPLDAPREVLIRRQHEPGEIDFFIQVGRAAHDWAARLGLPCLPTTWTHMASPTELATALAPLILERST